MSCATDGFSAMINDLVMLPFALLPTMRLSRARTRTRAPMNSMYPKNPMLEGRLPRPHQAASKNGGRRYQVRRSGVHGKGVFALRPIEAGEMIMEYTGPIISWKKAQRAHPHDPNDPLHTFYFHIDGGKVIDGKYGTNAAKWINH